MARSVLPCEHDPLFFVETLADLQKVVDAGRTPEHVGGRLAEETSVMSVRFPLDDQVVGVAGEAIDGALRAHGIGTRGVLLSAVIGGRAALVLRHEQVEQVFTPAAAYDEVFEYLAPLAKERA